MKIRDFFSELYDYIKVRSGVRRHSFNRGLYVQKGVVLKRNVFVDIVLSKKLKPPWLNRHETVKIFIPKLYKCRNNRDILAYFIVGNNKHPAVLADNKSIYFTFDPKHTIYSILGEKYYTPKRRFYTYFPFHMHILSGGLRRAIKKAMFLFNKKSQEFPSWPVDKSVETVRFVIYSSLKIAGEDWAPKLKWPNGKKYVICITHDIETMHGFMQISLFLGIERQFGLKSSWGIVSGHYKINHSLLEKMIAEGHELYLHDELHDNKLIYLNERDMKRRFTKMADFKNRYKIQGFRSPCLLRSERLFKALENEGYLYDMSVPDTESPSQIAFRNGCSSIFPYMIGNVIEIPITMPQDALLIFKKLDMLNIWIKKLKFIKKLGGIAVFNIHLEPHLSGNEKNIIIYTKLLKILTKDKDAWITTTDELANYCKKLSDEK